MSFIKKLEYGNYTLRFGRKVMLDAINEIVIPSFMNEKYKRKYKETDYIFTQVRLVNLDGDMPNEQISPLDDSSESLNTLIHSDINFVQSLANEKLKIPTLGLTGRLVKSSKITREQVYVNGRIVPDHQEMDTAPSSFFLLILNSHRLIICREMPGSPTIEEFQNTSQFCLAKRYNSYVDYEISKNKRMRTKKPWVKRIYKKNLALSLAPPKLRITPLTDPRSLEDFISKFSTIKSLNIKLLPTNNENLSLDDFWNSLENEKEETNSEKVSLTFSNTNEGLNSDAILQKTADATRLANSQVRISGVDDDGRKISGNNENFTLSTEAPGLPDDIEEATVISFERYKELIAEGSISQPQENLREDALDKLLKLCKRWNLL